MVISKNNYRISNVNLEVQSTIGMYIYFIHATRDAALGWRRDKCFRGYEQMHILISTGNFSYARTHLEILFTLLEMLILPTCENMQHYFILQVTHELVLFSNQFSAPNQIHHNSEKFRFNYYLLMFSPKIMFSLILIFVFE